MPPKILLGSGTQNLPPDIELLVIQIDRAMVESKAIGACVDDLMNLSDDPAVCKRLANRVIFFFSGYDNDPRAISNIPECRAFLQAIHAQWPFWAHFLIGNVDTWMTLITALVHVESSRAENGNIQHSLDPGEFRTLINSMCESLRNLHRHHGIALAETAQIERYTLNVIESVFGNTK